MDMHLRRGKYLEILSIVIEPTEHIFLHDTIVSLSSCTLKELNEGRRALQSVKGPSRFLTHPSRRRRNRKHTQREPLSCRKWSRQTDRPTVRWIRYWRERTTKPHTGRPGTNCMHIHTHNSNNTVREWEKVEHKLSSANVKKKHEILKVPRASR